MYHPSFPRIALLETPSGGLPTDVWIYVLSLMVPEDPSHASRFGDLLRVCRLWRKIILCPIFLGRVQPKIEATFNVLCLGRPSVYWILGNYDSLFRKEQQYTDKYTAEVIYLKVGVRFWDSSHKKSFVRTLKRLQKSSSGTSQDTHKQYLRVRKGPLLFFLSFKIQPSDPWYTPRLLLLESKPFLTPSKCNCDTIDRSDVILMNCFSSDHSFSIGPPAPPDAEPEPEEPPTMHGFACTQCARDVCYLCAVRCHKFHRLSTKTIESCGCTQQKGDMKVPDLDQSSDSDLLLESRDKPHPSDEPAQEHLITITEPNRFDEITFPISLFEDRDPDLAQKRDLVMHQFCDYLLSKAIDHEKKLNPSYGILESRLLHRETAQTQCSDTLTAVTGTFLCFLVSPIMLVLTLLVGWFFIVVVSDAPVKQKSYLFFFLWPFFFCVLFFFLVSLMFLPSAFLAWPRFYSYGWTEGWKRLFQDSYDFLTEFLTGY